MLSQQTSWIKSTGVLLCFRLWCTAEEAHHPVFKLTHYKERGHSKLMTELKTIQHQTTVSLRHPSRRVLMSVLFKGDQYFVRSSLGPQGRAVVQNVYGLCSRAGFNHTGRAKHQQRNRILFLGSSKRNSLLYFNMGHQNRKHESRHRSQPILGCKGFHERDSAVSRCKWDNKKAYSGTRM